MRKSRAAILGCGPAGLFAAHALIAKGWQVQIFSKKRRSEMFGAQYLHAPIPGLTDSDPVSIDYRLTGTIDGYREKVYGPASRATVSLQDLASSHQAWDIRQTYYNAWDRYSHLVHDYQVSPQFLGFARDVDHGGTFLASNFWDYVINTIPLPDLCYQNHEFQSTSIWAMGDAPERNLWAPYNPPENTVECNGDRWPAWYRASTVFGYSTVEWPGAYKPPLPGIAEVVKPISNNCNCYTGKKVGFRFLPLGRYGSWKKGVLSHQAYEEASRL